jgi:hypothetical protein
MTHKDLELENLSKEQLSDLADAAGRKLGLLLATAPMDADAKSAILEMIKGASPEQIDLLIKVLEENYLEAENESLRLLLKTDLISADSEYQSQKNVLEKKVAGKLNALLEGK